ncbi:serpin family protein [Paenibacillus sp. Soil787]|uniref:serpin family protein n=1 Tax=Paenibacillus sp. Soil787 TaxID=1736411 RepID=UPI001F273E06|nr:serpin family protein [Paenibacillus sp. Soil787]
MNDNFRISKLLSAVHMAGASAPIDEPFQVTINRPFFFAIEDRQTGAWLFVGSVVEP